MKHRALRERALAAALAGLASCALLPTAAAQALLFEGGAHGVSVPFEGLGHGRGGLLIALPLEHAGRTYRFLLDSAASGHAVSTTLVRELELPEVDRVRVRGIGRRDRQGRVHRLPALRLGAATLDGATAVGLALGDFGRPFGVRIDGVLGAPLFERQVVRIDYAAQRVALLRREHFEAPEGAMALPLDFVLRVPVVEARIDGREPVPLKVDTGSALALILYEDFVAEHALLGAERESYEAARLVGVGGELRARIGRLRRLALGAHELHETMTWLVEPRRRRGGFTAMEGFRGNLGSGVLRAFVVTFDVTGKRLWLEPRAPSPQRFAPDFGFEIDMDAASLRVRAVAAGSAADAAGLAAGDVVLGLGADEAAVDLAALTRAMAHEASLRLKVRRDAEQRVLVLERRPYLHAIRAPEDRVPTGGGRK